MKPHPSERLKELLGKRDRDVSAERVWKAIDRARSPNELQVKSRMRSRPLAALAVMAVFFVATTALGMRAWPAIRAVFEGAPPSPPAEAPRAEQTRRRPASRPTVPVAPTLPEPAEVREPEAPQSSAETSVRPEEHSVVTSPASRDRADAVGGGRRGVRATEGETRVPTADAATLLERADRARVEGRHRDAAADLERLIADHRESQEAPLAALALARVELEALGRPERAVRAVRLALSLGVPRQLDEGARFLLVDALERSGVHGEANEAAADYLGRHPRGVHAPELRQRLGRGENADE